MTKKTIAAIITGIMMLTAVPAFAATPHHDQKPPIHHEVNGHHHDKDHGKEIKPKHHKEVKHSDKKHIHDKKKFEQKNGITEKGRG